MSDEFESELDGLLKQLNDVKPEQPIQEEAVPDVTVINPKFDDNPKPPPEPPPGLSNPIVLESSLSINVPEIIKQHMTIRDMVISNLHNDRAEIQKAIDICLDKIDTGGDNTKSVYVESLVNALATKASSSTLAIKALDSTSKMLSSLQAYMPKESQQTIISKDELIDTLNSGLSKSDIGA